ncbi:MAG: DUF6614 family protein [Pseudomonadota bacterium]
MREREEDSSARPCSLFGTFNLRGSTDLASFKQAFDALCEHLRDRRYLQTWRLWERAYHDGYDAGFPDTSLVVEMGFPTHRAALEVWDCFESRVDPVGSLHLAVNSKVKDARFVLCRQLN